MIDPENCSFEFEIQEEVNDHDQSDSPVPFRNDPKLSQSSESESSDDEDSSEISDDFDDANARVYELRRSDGMSPRDTRNEIYRLKTFEKFPTSVPVSPYELAASGFFYTGHRDQVRCFSCNKHIENWKEGSNPRDWQYHDQECELMLEKNRTGAVLIQSRPKNLDGSMYIKPMQLRPSKPVVDSPAPIWSHQASTLDSGFSSIHSNVTSRGNLNLVSSNLNSPAEPPSTHEQVGGNSLNPNQQQNQASNCTVKELQLTFDIKETAEHNVASWRTASCLCQYEEERQFDDNYFNNSIGYTSYYCCKKKGFLPSPINSGSENSDDENHQEFMHHNSFENTEGLSKSLKDHYKRNLNLRKENDRLKSFERWNCVSSKITPEVLSRSGFFYVNLSLIMCIFCGCKVIYWDKNDDEERLNQHHLSRCKMASPTSPTKRTASTYIRTNQLTSEIPRGKYLLETFPTFTIHRRDPINPYMSDFLDRLATFDKNWPQRLVKFDAEKIAQAGFFYLGFNDHVKCYYCNGKLQNLNQVDGDFCDEHEKQFPWCNLTALQREESLQTDYGHNSTEKLGSLLNNKYSNKSVLIKTKQEEELITSEATSITESITDIITPSKSNFQSVPNFNGSAAGIGSSSTADLHGGEIDERMCRLCLGERANVVVFPCKHLVVCTKCDPKVVNCPVCNEVKQSTLFINLF